MAEGRHAFTSELAWSAHGPSDRAWWLLEQMDRKWFAYARLYNSVPSAWSVVMSGRNGEESLGGYML